VVPPGVYLCLSAQTSLSHRLIRANGRTRPLLGTGSVFSGGDLSGMDFGWVRTASHHPAALCDAWQPTEFRQSHSRWQCSRLRSACQEMEKRRRNFEPNRPWADSYTDKNCTTNSGCRSPGITEGCH